MYNEKQYIKTGNIFKAKMLLPKVKETKAIIQGKSGGLE